MNKIKILPDKLQQKGGIYALVGATGVGKTTTIIKLAARYAKAYGAHHIGILSIDTKRVGAVEQLQRLGMVLGIPVRVVQDAESLGQALFKFKDKQLILIDTPGINHRLHDLKAQFSLFNHIGRSVTSYLVLPSTAQKQVLDESVNAFACVEPEGVVLTKLDEASNLGEVISVLVEHQSPLAYSTNGQKIPEDLKPADINYIVNQAVMLRRAQKTKLAQTNLAYAFQGAS